MLAKCCRAAVMRFFVFILIVAAPVLARSSQPGASEPTASRSSLTATLDGKVVDEHEAVVPDASVLVKDNKGELKRRAKTDSDGSFLFSLLPPGNYTVVVESRGFLPAEVKDVALKVNDRLELKIRLKVGNIGETVTVELAFPRSSPAVATVVDRGLVENLPINGRNLLSLISLSPGLVLTKTNFTEQGQFSVNGQRANANYFMVDGVSANIGVAAGAGLGQSGVGALPGLSVFGATNNLFSIDGLQELRVQTSTYAPEFGRMPGAQISVSTSSGSNQLRGTLFEHFRHDAMGAGDWFANRDNLRKPPSRLHNFGIAAGGPVIKDRAFFFLSYEGVRLRAPQVQTVEVPSLAARQSAPAQIRPYLNAFPVPNAGETANGLAQFAGSHSDPSALDATSLRLDFKPRENLTLFSRYNYAPSSASQRGASSSPNTLTRTSFWTQTLTAGVTSVVSPTVSNDLRANYSRTTAKRSFSLDDFGGAVPPGSSLLFPAPASLADSVYGFSLGQGISFFLGRDIDNIQRQINVVDNLSVLAGAHQLKFGFDYRRMFPVYGQRRNNHLATFDGVAGALAGTASSVLIVTQDEVALAFTNLSAYAQATWRASPRLTLTYGLRWELNPPPSGAGGQDLFTAEGLTDPATLSLAEQGTPLYRTTYCNFAPRAGFAYQLFRKQGTETVLRGGGGVFYDLGAGMAANSASYFPYLRRKSFAQVPYPLDAASAEPRLFSLNPPISTVRVFEPDFSLPMTLQWNVSVDQSLGHRQTASASYVGAVGRRLLRSEALFNPNPTFALVFAVTGRATSDYHALQLQFQRRLSRGLQALVSYTWAHSIDTNSNDSFNNVPAAEISLRSDRGPSDFDVRHSLGAAFTYNLPAPIEATMGKRLLRDWSLDMIITARTATPVDVVRGVDLGFGLFNFRPDLVRGVPVYLDDSTAPGGRIVNRAAFAVPSAARQGTLGRNGLRGFPMSQLDLALRRRLSLGERLTLQIGAEAFNLFNRPNFGDPVGDLNSNFFGRSTAMLGRSLGSGGGSGGLTPLYQTGHPRFIQLALKLHF